MVSDKRETRPLFLPCLSLFIHCRMAIATCPGVDKVIFLCRAYLETMRGPTSALLARVASLAVARAASLPADLAVIFLRPRGPFPLHGVPGLIIAALAMGSRGPSAFPLPPRPSRGAVTSASRRAEVAARAVTWRSALAVPARARIVPGRCRLLEPRPRMGVLTSMMMVIMLMSGLGIARAALRDGSCLRLGPTGGRRSPFRAGRPSTPTTVMAAGMTGMTMTMTPVELAARL